ncbi:hypothetical protein [Foetidibacter luteolus]|uniref:hypothetical protein n=1 Tax=Foetidibacter luteolus TaxID=2608880 RepID=UPI00129A2608|nr:hypothetical protein [Foetidibacter luteolus]
MRFIYDGNIYPLMEKVAFVKINATYFKDEYLKWRDEQNYYSTKFDVKRVGGTLQDAVMSLLPFNSEKKVIIIPTNSNWVAYIDNNEDAQTEKAVVIAKRLKVECIDVCAFINSFGTKANDWGGGWIQIFDSLGSLVRRVELTWQEKWEFEQYGMPQEFENLQMYKQKFQRDRFTPEMLDAYCKYFGIDFFNEAFYFPEGVEGYLISDIPKEVYQRKTVTLNEARKFYGLGDSAFSSSDNLT